MPPLLLLPCRRRRRLGLARRPQNMDHQLPEATSAWRYDTERARGYWDLAAPVKENHHIERHLKYRSITSRFSMGLFWRNPIFYEWRPSRPPGGSVDAGQPFLPQILSLLRPRNPFWVSRLQELLPVCYLERRPLEPLEGPSHPQDGPPTSRSCYQNFLAK